MAAYAALVSLMHLIEQIKNHPNLPLSLEQKQAESLTDKISFLQGFLEDFHSRGISQEIQALESRIADAAHAAEDVIESHVVDSILLVTTGTGSTTDLFNGLRRVVKVMESIEKEVMMHTSKKTGVEVEKRPRRRSLLPKRSSQIENTVAMMGFDDVLIEIMDRLTDNQPRRKIVAVAGMGGAGKTTLARNIYQRRFIVDHFDTRSWVTISLECYVKEVLIELHLCQRNHRSREALSREKEEDLGEQLYQSLCGRKYLVVMDDIWSIEVWDQIKFYFPDNNNGSRIMMTTRLSKLASDLTGSSHAVNLDRLDDETSWNLLCKKVFAERSCPLELVEIGRTIARNCRGLPLSIVTIGGLLAKTDMDRRYWNWKDVAENLSSLVNSEDEERCLSILSLSYINLPVRIKPCFLFMGIFREDERIRASYLIKLWVAEGFLKPIRGKALEVVGEDYLKDLVERNLLSVDELGSTGKIRVCVIHDLLRDLCVREAQKEKFLREHPFSIHGSNYNTKRDITIRRNSLYWSNAFPPHLRKPYATPFLRSFMIDCKKETELLARRSAQLLRILAIRKSYRYSYNLDEIAPLVNLRLLSCNSDHFNARFEDIPLLWATSWNLQTLLVDGFTKFANTLPLNIWEMPQLRHVKFGEPIDLSDPPPSSAVLENLQTLSIIENFKCSEEAVGRIPNINKLSISYNESSIEGKASTDYCLNNLGRLQNLESLALHFLPAKSWRNWLVGLTLPRSLKKLTLSGTGLRWDEDMSTMIGSLPHLQALKLKFDAFVGEEWNPVEGQFRRLKYLEMSWCTELKFWNADNSHFPCLEHLRILFDSSLEAVPLGFGEITTLRLIELIVVRDSVVVSCNRILKEQEEQLGNLGLVHVHLHVHQEQRELLEEEESLASDNFKIYFH